MKHTASFVYDFVFKAQIRQSLYLLGGGNRDYVDIGYKARACVDHDRKCAEIYKGRVK